MYIVVVLHFVLVGSLNIVEEPYQLVFNHYVLQLKIVHNIDCNSLQKDISSNWFTGLKHIESSLLDIFQIFIVNCNLLKDGVDIAFSSMSSMLINHYFIAGGFARWTNFSLNNWGVL